VDLVLADGEAVDFGWRVRDGARVSVYPVFGDVDIAALSRVRPPLLDRRAFIADVHLGRLARYMRLAGFDTLWRADARDDELARLARDARRILLTRDVGLLKRGDVAFGYWVRATEPARQLAEVLRRFDVGRLTAPFTRCLRCNTLLEPIAKEAIVHRLPPRVRQEAQTFSHCPTCDRVYWPGTHWNRMRLLLASAVGRV
jgi:hypothetical protein